MPRTLTQLAAAAASCLVLTSSAYAKDKEGTYLVYLNPFRVQEYETQATKEGYVRPSVPRALREEERTGYVLKHLDEFMYSPGVERAKNELIHKFGLQEVRETKTVLPAFYARLNQHEVELLKESDYVVSVDEVESSDKTSGFSAYYDYTENGEIIPWARQAIGVTSVTSPSNFFFIVDSMYHSPALSNELNIYLTNDNGVDGGHAANVLSIAAGKANSFGVRGISPGQYIVHRGLMPNGYGYFTNTSVADEIAIMSAIADWMGQFSTMNFSFNITSGSNWFTHTERAGKAIRRASGRLLVTQSAGNTDENACNTAFSYNNTAAQDNDGIIVVGGTDRFGQRMLRVTNPGETSDVLGSNYGACVEAWAPAQHLPMSESDGTLQVYSGTSFAAPIVAALAGRYGDTQTRPIEREAYIKAGLQHTGYYENAAGSNRPIKQIKYTDPSIHAIPTHLPISRAYSKTNTANLNYLTDGVFYSDFWNANDYWGSIVLDLGRKRTVKGVRVMMRSSADGGRIDFAVHGGNSISMLGTNAAEIPANPLAYKTVTDQFDLVPYYIPINGYYRYIMLEANNYVSWLAYSEVEVYGY